MDGSVRLFFFSFLFFDCDVGCLGMPGSDRSMFLER